MTDTVHSSGVSDASSPTASETNPASRYSDYSGCDGYLTARSSAATRGGVTGESECFGDVSSTEVVSERGVASAMSTSKRDVHSSVDRGRACSSSSMLQSAEIDMSDADVTVKRRRVTGSGLSEDDSQVSLTCHLVATGQRYHSLKIVAGLSC